MKNLLSRFRAEIRRVDRTDEEIVREARRAESLLNDEVLANAFDQAEVEFYSIMVESPEQEARNEARACILALEEVKRVLRSKLSAGQVVEAQNNQN